LDRYGRVLMGCDLFVEKLPIFLRTGKVSFNSILALKLGLRQGHLFLRPHLVISNFVIFGTGTFRSMSSMSMSMSVTMSVSMSMGGRFRCALRFVRVGVRTVSMTMLFFLMHMCVLSMRMRYIFRVVIAVLSNMVILLNHVSMTDLTMSMHLLCFMSMRRFSMGMHFFSLVFIIMIFTVVRFVNDVSMFNTTMSMLLFFLVNMGSFPMSMVNQRIMLIIMFMGVCPVLMNVLNASVGVLLVGVGVSIFPMRMFNLSTVIIVVVTLMIRLHNLMFVRY